MQIDWWLSLELLCSATVSEVSAGVCHRNKVNSITWLNRRAQPKDSILYIYIYNTRYPIHSYQGAIRPRPKTWKSILKDKQGQGLAWCMRLTQFLCQAIILPHVSREPRRDPSNCRLYEHGIWYISDTANSLPVPSQVHADSTKRISLLSRLYLELLSDKPIHLFSSRCNGRTRDFVKSGHVCRIPVYSHWMRFWLGVCYCIDFIIHANKCDGGITKIIFQCQSGAEWVYCLL